MIDLAGSGALTTTARLRLPAAADQDGGVARRSIVSPARRPADGPSVTSVSGSRPGLMPAALRSVLPSGGPSPWRPALGAARTISPVANAATSGAPGRPVRVAGNRDPQDQRPARPFTLRRSPGPGPALGVPTAGPAARMRNAGGPAAPTGGPAAAAVRGVARPWAEPAGPAGPDRPPAAAHVAGLLLRQVIPAAAVVDAAIAGVIRRMPPAPPTGTPRLGSHRSGGDRRGPDVPLSADPNWSFTGARGQRALTGAAIGARSRGSGPVTMPVPAVGQVEGPMNPTVAATDVASRRGSLVDLIPPSLFDRARAGLTDPSGDGSGGIQALATSREVAVSSPTDDVVPQQVAEALTPREWDELVDIIVDRLEDRVLDELARRGRRFTPGVF